MKNLMAAVAANETKINELTTALQAQVENSLDLGWQPSDILIVTNFPFDYMGVRAIQDDYESGKLCLTGAKMFAVYYAIRRLDITDTIWAHDLDCWQNVWFDEPQIADCGFARYSTSKLNGGSAFWKSSAEDLVADICTRIAKEQREEPTINKVLRSKQNKDRLTILNESYNVGCSAYSVRFSRADKPIKCSHFHPTNRIAVQTHLLDRDGLGYVSVCPRLERIIRKHYPSMATALDDEGLLARKRKIDSRGKSSATALLVSHVEPQQEQPLATEIVSMPAEPATGGYTQVQSPAFIQEAEPEADKPKQKKPLFII